MNFSEKVKNLRKEKGYTQKQLASELGVTLRMVQFYESGHSYPKNRAQYRKLADILGCDLAFLLTDEEAFLTEAQERYGSHGRRQAQELVNDLCAMFAGGELSEEDKDAVLRSLQEAYWDAKDSNRKNYAPKK